MSSFMFRAALVVLGTTAVGCGGEYTPSIQATDNREISQDFAGDWVGSATLTIGVDNAGERPVDVQVHTAAQGPALDVSIPAFCNGHALLLHAEGTGRSTMWYGKETCTVKTDACASLSLVYTSAVLKVLDDGRFYALLNGAASGCGRTSDAAVEIYAAR